MHHSLHDLGEHDRTHEEIVQHMDRMRTLEINIQGIGCSVLAGLLKLSLPQFPHPENEDNGTYHLRQL